MRLTFIACLISVVLSGYGQYRPEEIEIIRDQWGVPHIHAPTDPQVAYGLAWAHAEDDFVTIQQTLLAAKQMLGRHLGKEGAPIDYVVGLLRCEAIVKNGWEKVDPKFMQLVDGYVAGINAYAAKHKKEVLVKKAFPVSRLDVFKAYVLQLAVQDGADQLIRNLFDGTIDTVKSFTKGSNAFAISRRKTTTGETFLAINSHQPLEGPAAWYEAHLISDEGWNILGGLFPGGPVIFHGTNANLGWAHTVNYFDKRDVFQLEMHPDKEDHYRVEDTWLKLEKSSIRLKVKIAPGINIGVERDAYHSIYGPTVKNEKGVFSFHMAVFDEIRAIEQWYKMNKATNLSEFKSALEMVAIPSFNIVYADRWDSLFYVGNGKIPLRDPAYNWRSTLPGNTKSTLTKAYHPFEDLPQITNPESGYLFNTNNSAFNASAASDNLSFSAFDPTMGYRQFENNRSLRFMELIDSYGRLSWEDFLAIKYDGTLPDSLVYRINLNPLFRLDPSKAGKGKEVLAIIQQWDKSARADAVGPAHLKLIYNHLASLRKSTISEDDYYEAASWVYDYLMTHFNTVNVRLGEYQKLVRGTKELPLGGIPDVITAMYSKPLRDGMVQGRSGESYIMLVRYPKDGLPIIETVNVYGASNRPESAHYDDQMELFTSLQRKSMTLDLEKVREAAARIYHPE